MQFQILFFYCLFSQCLAALGVGACPDDRLGGMDNATLISSQTRDGITYITYEKPLIGEAGKSKDSYLSVLYV